MSRFAIVLLALCAALTGTAGGYFYGLHMGGVTEAAARDGKAVKDLTDIVTAHTGLVKASKTASASMRKALGTRAAQDAETTKDFKDALKATADSRAGCLFDTGVMRQLGEARDRAASAATGGILNSVPAAPGGAAHR